MNQTRLQKDIENINKQFDERDIALKNERQKLIDNTWRYHTLAGTLKQDLDQLVRDFTTKA